MWATTHESSSALSGSESWRQTSTRSARSRCGHVGRSAASPRRSARSRNRERAISGATAAESILITFAIWPWESRRSSRNASTSRWRSGSSPSALWSSRATLAARLSRPARSATTVVLGPSGWRLHASAAAASDSILPLAPDPRASVHASSAAGPVPSTRLQNSRSSSIEVASLVDPPVQKIG